MMTEDALQAFHYNLPAMHNTVHENWMFQPVVEVTEWNTPNNVAVFVACEAALDFLDRLKSLHNCVANNLNVLFYMCNHHFCTL